MSPIAAKTMPDELTIRATRKSNITLTTDEQHLSCDVDDRGEPYQIVGNVLYTERSNLGKKLQNKLNTNTLNSDLRRDLNKEWVTPKVVDFKMVPVPNSTTHSRIM